MSLPFSPGKTFWNPFEHPLGSADHFPLGGQPGVGLVQPRGQPDPTRQVVEFGNGETIVRQDQIRPDHPRHRIAQLPAATVLDQAPGLPSVEISRDP